MSEPTDKPLLPRTAAGATIVAVPIATLLAGFGWVGQKVLALDEDFRAVQAVQLRHGSQIEQLESTASKLDQKLVADATNTNRNLMTLDKVEARQVDALQRLARLEATSAIKPREVKP